MVDAREKVIESEKGYLICCSRFEYRICRGYLNVLPQYRLIIQDASQGTQMDTTYNTKWSTLFLATPK
jgi:hypothetical protein